MTIGQYEGGVSGSLPGARRDEINASQLADLLSFDRGAVSFLKDEQLTREGMLNALKSFAASVRPGDRVLIYYSGHGTSFKNQDQCEQALLSYDNKPVSASDLSQTLDLARQTAGRWIVIMDACHSGGVADRLAVPRGGQATTSESLRPKFKPVDACSIPGNSKLWQARLGQRGAELVQGHETFIAASASDEVAIDSDEGGLATLALIDCLSSSQTERDLNAIRLCSQAKLDARLASSQSYYPHHLQLIGNTVRPASSSIKRHSFVEWIALLEQLSRRASKPWVSTLSMSTNRVPLDGAPVPISIQSNRTGFARVYVIHEESGEMHTIFPEADLPFQVQPDTMIRLPVELSANGKPGGGRLFAVLTQTQEQQTVVQQWLRAADSVRPLDLDDEFSMVSIGFQTVAN